MPTYDFRCRSCGESFSVTTRTYAEYDSAVLACPGCGSAELARLIRRVSIAGRRHDYQKMSSGEMLNVLESGDQGEVEAMFKRVSGGASASGIRPSKPQGKSTAD